MDDETAVEEFFSQTHLPLAEQLVGLRKSEVSRIKGKPGGQSRFTLMYELYFENEQSYQVAMLTDVGAALVKALKPWGDAKIVTWFYAESFEEETNQTE